jgi:hypothetical protein
MHNAFDAASIYYLGKWEGLGPENLDFQDPTHSHLPSQRMLPASKALHTGQYKS